MFLKSKLKLILFSLTIVSSVCEDPSCVQVSGLQLKAIEEYIDALPEKEQIRTLAFSRIKTDHRGNLVLKGNGDLIDDGLNITLTQKDVDVIASFASVRGNPLEPGTNVLKEDIRIIRDIIPASHGGKFTVDDFDATSRALKSSVEQEWFRFNGKFNEGDVFTKIAGEDVTGMTVDETVQKLHSEYDSAARAGRAGIDVEVVNSRTGSQFEPRNSCVTQVSKGFKIVGVVSRAGRSDVAGEDMWTKLQGASVGDVVKVGGFSDDECVNIAGEGICGDGLVKRVAYRPEETWKYSKDGRENWPYIAWTMCRAQCEEKFKNSHPHELLSGPPKFKHFLLQRYVFHFSEVSSITVLSQDDVTAFTSADSTPFKTNTNLLTSRIGRLAADTRVTKVKGVDVDECGMTKDGRNVWTAIVQAADVGDVAVTSSNDMRVLESAEEIRKHIESKPEYFRNISTLVCEEQGWHVTSTGYGVTNHIQIVNSDLSSVVQFNPTIDANGEAITDEHQRRDDLIIYNDGSQVAVKPESLRLMQQFGAQKNLPDALLSSIFFMAGVHAVPAVSADLFFEGYAAQFPVRSAETAVQDLVARNTYIMNSSSSGTMERSDRPTAGGAIRQKRPEAGGAAAARDDSDSDCDESKDDESTARLKRPEAGGAAAARDDSDCDEYKDESMDEESEHKDSSGDGDSRSSTVTTQYGHDAAIMMAVMANYDDLDGTSGGQGSEDSAGACTSDDVGAGAAAGGDVAADAAGGIRRGRNERAVSCVSM